jgi:hypothetical protein
VAKLLQQLGTGALVLLARQGGAVVAAWAEGGSWTRRYQASVEAGKESAFADALLAASAVAPPDGCRSAADCSAGAGCQEGRCVEAGGARPIYKKWWFWTIIGGVVVAGATTGIVLGARGKSPEWSAELAPRGGL